MTSAFFHSKVCLLFWPRADSINSCLPFLRANKTILTSDISLTYLRWNVFFSSCPEERFSCDKCGSPLCPKCKSPSSARLHLHTNEECQILSACFHQNLGTFPYHAIMPLRLALEAAKNSQIWENLHLLMDHEAEIKKNIEEWSFFQREVCQIL